MFATTFDWMSIRTGQLAPAPHGQTDADMPGTCLISHLFIAVIEDTLAHAKDDDMPLDDFSTPKAMLQILGSSGVCGEGSEKSPANHLVRYERRPFVSDLGDDLTEYEAEPSPELDEKWDDLYRMGIVAVSQEQARHLEEKTQPLPHDPENRYVLGMSVFHDLHCLNMLRKHLLPDYYPEQRNASSTKDGFLHITHCVGAPRQSIMCHVDLAIIPFQALSQWNEEWKFYQPQIAGDHTCRSFEAVRNWAREHALDDEWDHEYRPVNDPLDPDTWVPGWHP